jgi:hypothetical protein
MVESAERDAAEFGITNAECRVLDAERLNSATRASTV